MAIALAWPQSAFAWPFEALSEVSLPGAPLRAVALAADGSGRLQIASASGASAVSLLTGAVTALEVGPAPSSPVVSVQTSLDDDDLPELVSLAPGFLSIQASGVSTAVQHRVGVGFSELLAGDVDGDGCGDVVLVDRALGRAQLIRSTACAGVPLHIGPSDPLTYRDRVRYGARDDYAAVAPRYDDSPLDGRAPSFLGIELPPILGASAVTPAERLARQRYMLVGTGWVYGGSARPDTHTVPIFPAISVGMEWGGPRFRAYTGIDSGGLFYWVNDDNVGGAHLLDLSLGVAAGSPRFRAGPFVTGGLYSVGAGLRAVLTPWRVSPTELGGLEARLTWFTPATGEVMLLYVWSEARRAPSQGRRSTHLPATGVVPGGPIVCSRLGAGLGAALSASGTGEAWEFVGSGQPIAVGGSPLVSVSCDMGGEHAGAMVSAQIAPLLRYLTGNGQAQHHLGTVSMGWMVGSPGVRFGPVATIGFWEAQAGARAVADVWVDREGLHHRVELRAGLLTSSVGAGEASLAYVVSYDPRGKPSGS